jgi:hypothetical protein
MKLHTSKLIAHAIALTVGLCAGLSASASTIVFNNISPTTPYYSNFGAWLGTFGQQYAVTATSFTPSASGQLDELTLGLFYQTGQNSVTLRLSPDTLGLPGAPIWQTTVAPAPGYGFLLNVTGIGGPTLNAGQQYWLEGVAPVTPATLHGWYTNNQGDVGSVISAGNFIPDHATLLIARRSAGRWRRTGTGRVLSVNVRLVRNRANSWPKKVACTRSVPAKNKN